jgi:hypothetical protein
MPLNLKPLERYRLQTGPDFQSHCRQEDALVAGLRTEGNGLVVHRPNCKFLQKTIALNDTDLTNWPKFGTVEQDFQAFQDLAKHSGVQLFFTCRSTECRDLQRTLGILIA